MGNNFSRSVISCSGAKLLPHSLELGVRFPSGVSARSRWAGFQGAPA